MRKARAEPQRFFSPGQWAEFANAISLASITCEGKREICDAIFDYELARTENERETYETSEKSTRRRVDPRAKGRAALNNFVKYVRGLREAFSSVEAYLKRDDLITEAQELSERIYGLQKKAQQELDKKSFGGRPGQKIRDDLVLRLAVIYERLTGDKPTRSVNRKGQVSGRFSRFVYAIFRAHRIPEIGLPNAIAKATSYAKNPR